MRQAVFIAAFLFTLVQPCFALADDLFGEARCRAGALQSNPDREFAQALCADVKSEADGICRAGYLAHSTNKEEARQACADVKDETEARCRARILFRYGNIQGARTGCRTQDQEVVHQTPPVPNYKNTDFESADSIKSAPGGLPTRGTWHGTTSSIDRTRPIDDSEL